MVRRRPPAEIPRYARNDKDGFNPAVQRWVERACLIACSTSPYHPEEAKDLWYGVRRQQRFLATLGMTKMPRARQYYVYIMSSESRVLYTGVTNDLNRRVHQHREGTGSEFTKKYRLNRLAYFEATSDVLSAIAREKRIQGWTRKKKLFLITTVNPMWRDLSGRELPARDSSLRSE